MDHLIKFDVFICWTEIKVWTFRQGSKSIQMSLNSWEDPPKPYKLSFFYNFGDINKNGQK